MASQIDITEILPNSDDLNIHRNGLISVVQDILKVHFTWATKCVGSPTNTHAYFMQSKEKSNIVSIT